MWSEVNKKREFCILSTRFLFHIWVLEALKHILYDTANFSTTIIGWITEIGNIVPATILL